MDTHEEWLDYRPIASKMESVALHPPLPVLWVFELEECLESDGTRVNGIGVL